MMIVAFCSSRRWLLCTNEREKKERRSLDDAKSICFYRVATIFGIDKKQTTLGHSFWKLISVLLYGIYF